MYVRSSWTFGLGHGFDVGESEHIAQEFLRKRSCACWDGCVPAKSSRKSAWPMRK